MPGLKTLIGRMIPMDEMVLNICKLFNVGLQPQGADFVLLLCLHKHALVVIDSGI